MADPVVVAARQQISCDLADEVAILNLESGVYYGIDAVGALIWNLVQQPRTRSEERRVGKECRSRWSPYH